MNSNLLKRLKRTTNAQYEELLQFLEQNKVLIYGKTKPQEAGNVKKLWDNFAKYINPMGLGLIKTGEQWKKIFVEWKSNVKRKSRESKIERDRPGGGGNPAKKLTDLEERLLNLISNIHLGLEELPDRLGSANQQVVVQENSNIGCDRNISNESPTEEVEKISKLIDNMSEAEEIPKLIDNISEVEEIPKLIDNIREAEEIPKLIYNISADEIMIEPTDQLLASEDTISKEIKTNPLTTNNRKSKQCSEKRYTSGFLESAANSYNAAQDMRYNAAVKNAESVTYLAEAINNYVKVHREHLEIEKLRVETEAIKARAQLMKAKTELMKMEESLFEKH